MASEAVDKAKAALSGAKEAISGTLNNVKEWILKNKTIVIGAGVGALVLIILICVCICKCRSNKKKKKDAEKLKMKGAKPSKKLRKIQPNKSERKAMEEVGSIKFSLQYEQQSEMLVVKVTEAEDLPVRDLSGYAYSYVKAKLLPLHQHFEEEYKSTLVRAGFWPQYAHTFSIVVEDDDLNDQILYLYVYELNRWSKSDGIGQIAIELDDFNLKNGIEVPLTKKLRPYDPLIGLEVETGAVKLSFDYDMETWELEAEIIAADIIPQDEDKEKANSYVTLTLLNQEDEVLEKQKSCVKKNTLRPEYDDTVKFTVPENLLPTVKVLVQLKSPKLFAKNILLGKSTILPDSDNWKQLIEKEYTEGWFSVFLKPRKE